MENSLPHQALRDLQDAQSILRQEMQAGMSPEVTALYEFVMQRNQSEIAAVSQQLVGPEVEAAIEAAQSLHQIDTLSSLTVGLAVDPTIQEKAAALRASKVERIVKAAQRLGSLDLRDDPRIAHVVEAANYLQQQEAVPTMTIEQAPPAISEPSKPIITTEIADRPKFPYKRLPKSFPPPDICAERLNEHVTQHGAGEPLLISASELYGIVFPEGRYDTSNHSAGLKVFVGENLKGITLGVRGRRVFYVVNPGTRIEVTVEEPEQEIAIPESADSAGPQAETPAQVEAPPATEATTDKTRELDKYLDPTTSLLLASFLNLVKDELSAMGYEPFDSGFVDILLQQYPDVLTSKDLQTSRTDALTQIAAMFKNPSITEAVYYELLDCGEDPREPLYSYLTNLFQISPDKVYAVLSDLLNTKREILVTLIHPKRSAPHVEELTVIPRQIPTAPEPAETEIVERQPTPYTMDALDAALLGSFLHTLQKQLQHAGFPPLDKDVLRALVSTPGFKESYHPLEDRARLHRVVNWATDAERILQAVSQLDDDDPRTPLLTHLYDSFADPDLAATLKEFMLNNADTQVTLYLGVEEQRVEEQIQRPEKPEKKQPVAERLCRNKIGALLQTLINGNVDLNATHTTGRFFEVLGGQARNAVGSGKEHQILTVEGAGRVSVEDMVYAMLRIGSPKIVEFAGRQEKMVRNIIKSAIAKIEQQKHKS